MSERAGFECTIRISGASVAMTNEPTTTSDNISYQITDPTRQVLDRVTPLTVRDGGVITAEAFTANLLNGRITFLTPVARTITVTGRFLPMTIAAFAHAMDRTETAAMLEATPFLTTHKRRRAGLRSASGTLSDFHVVDSTHRDILQAQLPVVIEDRTHSAGLPTRFWALLDSEAVSAAVDGLQNKVISWVSFDEWIRLGG